MPKRMIQAWKCSATLYPINNINEIKKDWSQH